MLWCARAGLAELPEAGYRHWTENDCLPWFKERFTTSFDGNTILSGFSDAVPGLVGELSCWKLEKCAGEASITKRKGKKVIVIYELEVEIKWEAILRNAAGESVSSSKGAYKMPCIDTVEDIDKFEIQVMQ
jgi:activator of HSP90 ATPase